MGLTPEQIKGRIKSFAKENNADPRVLLRIFMMERFIERISVSSYSENFIIKGGILVTSMVGVMMRSTMDIDSTIRNLNLTIDEITKVVKDICEIDPGDGIIFELKDVTPIMDEMEYPGVRLTLNALMGKMVTPIKIDISTADAITPRAISYSYKLMLENRTIKVWSYNLETMLAEKLQTVLSRGVLNTRMRDLYDIHTLLALYNNELDASMFCKAFDATCKNRKTQEIKIDALKIIEKIRLDDTQKKLWTTYQKKYSYASTISFEEIINSVTQLCTLAHQRWD